MSAINLLLGARSLAPAVVTYIGNNSVSGINTASHTFTSQGIGTAASDRFVVVGVKVSEYTSTITISSVTIAGNSATRLGSLVRPSSNDIAVAFYGVVVASGTTGDIVINTTGGNIRQAVIGVWTVTGLLSTTPVATYSDNTVSASVMSAAISAISAGAVMIAFAAHRSAASFTWSNASEDFELSDGTDRGSGASASYPAGASGFTLTATGSGGSADGGLTAIVLR